MISVPLLCAACVLAAPVNDLPTDSYLCSPAYSLEETIHGPVRPYQFQPGDIVLPTDHTVFWSVTHDMAGAFQPHHSGIIIASGPTAAWASWRRGRTTPCTSASSTRSLR
jgi:hypothetical protein